MPKRIRAVAAATFLSVLTCAASAAPDPSGGARADVRVQLTHEQGWITESVPFVPLAQTFLWIVLISVLIFWLRAELRSMVDAVRNRIASGSAVKVGPLELSELRPQTPEAQRERLETEVEEAVQQVATPTGDPLPPLRDVKTSYLQAEDLALRAVQSKFGVPLSRQVSIPGRANFDAVFARDGLVYVVEVKVFLGSVTTSKLRVAVQRLSQTSSLLGPNTRILLVLVYKSAQNIEPNEQRVQDAIADTIVPIELLIYSLPDLQRRFGAPSGAF